MKVEEIKKLAQNLEAKKSRNKAIAECTLLSTPELHIILGDIIIKSSQLDLYEIKLLDKYFFSAVGELYLSGKRYEEFDQILLSKAYWETFWIALNRAASKNSDNSLVLFERFTQFMLSGVSTYQIDTKQANAIIFSLGLSLVVGRSTEALTDARVKVPIERLLTLAVTSDAEEKKIIAEFLIKHLFYRLKDLGLTFHALNLEGMSSLEDPTVPIKSAANSWEYNWFVPQNFL